MIFENGFGGRYFAVEALCSLSSTGFASATARQVLLAAAAESLGVGAETLEVNDGLITSSDSNEQTDYWSIQGGRPFDITLVDALNPPLKNPHGYRIVGHKQQRLDLPAKFSGTEAFVHDMSLPHMRHARLVKPPTPDARLEDCPEELSLAGVEIVRDGSFLAVVADREQDAVQAAALLGEQVQWTINPIALSPEEIPDYLQNKATHSLPVVDGTPQERPVAEPPPPTGAALTLSAGYYRPFQMHAAMGPSAAVAQFMNGILTVYSHSQGVEVLKLALAAALDLPPEQVHVIHREGAGCYGHNGADDVALDAALLAMAIEPAPVKVCWSRADEHGYEPYAPAAWLQLEASLDDSGQVIDWRHESYSFSHGGRPHPSRDPTSTSTKSNLRTSWWREKPMTAPSRKPALMNEVGIHRNLQPIYAFDDAHLVKHLVADSPLVTSSLRGLGAFANVFAIESFMDELSHAASQDPFDFRLSHLQDERARAVLKVLREKAGPPPTRVQNAGRGIAIARYKNRQTYCAVLVDLSVADDASVMLDRALLVADAGLVIDPDGLINQLEGGFVQAASMTLKEEVRWDADGVTSRDWASYPILTFSEVPIIETHLMDKRLEPALGAGEASTGPTPAAIANAIFDASGIRGRMLPFTPSRLRAAAAS